MACELRNAGNLMIPSFERCMLDRCTRTTASQYPRLSCGSSPIARGPSLACLVPCLAGVDSAAERTAHGNGERHRHLRLAAEEPDRGYLFRQRPLRR